MKKNLLFTLFLTVSSFTFGQVTTNGPLKITSPNSNGYTQVGPLNPYFSHFTTDRPLHYFDKTITVNGAIGSYSGDLKLQAARTTQMTITTNGKVGIGTSSPSEKLHISNGNLNITNSKGGIKIIPWKSSLVKWNIDDGPVIGSTNNIIYFYTENTGDAGSWNTLRCSGVQAVNEVNDQTNATYSSDFLNLSVNGKNVFVVSNQGYAKLEGKFIASEIEVKPDVWSDFVFNKDYNLPPLQEVSQHIANHKHLPGVPSEKQVAEEGINLGEMDAILLQKIEELTLYTIEQQKLIEEQSEKIKHLEKKVLSK